MKIKPVLCLIAILCTYSLTTFAQSPFSIKGVARDSIANTKLLNTTISVLNAKDSTLVKFTRANEAGSFSITNLRAGKFILLVTYPEYADYVEHFTLEETLPVKDFKNINMTTKATLLENVIIKGKAAAIKIKGDTTEFNASSYEIQPNSKVEDLLMQLPGIQVDKDGKITAQGKTVNKVLVDGEEFFGDDPTLVTKNIRGDMVDKVQLYDKKSDQATFTGIDDGEASKTINIKLKEDKKNGYFGKIDVGGGTDEFYQGQAMFNAFKARQKFSAYATIANTGQTGLGWQDNNKYSASSNVSFSDDGGMMFSFGGGDDFDSFDGRYNGQGIPLAQTGGLHYDSKSKDGKQTFNTNYKIGSIGVEGNRNSLTQNNLPTGIINSNTDQNFDNQMFRQKLDGTYFANLDSTSTIKVSVDGTLKKSETRDDFIAISQRFDNSLLNTSSRSLTNDGDQQLFNASALYTKKFKKKGRTVSVNVSQSLNKNTTDGYLNSINSFYNNSGGLDSVQNINQYKTDETLSSVLNSNITYTEPVAKSLALVLNYGLGINHTSSDRRSFNQSGSGQYDVLDPLFSNDFDLNQLTNQGGAIFNYKQGKTTINAGTKVTGVKFDQVDKFTNNEFNRNFINWNPQASVQYRFSQQRSLGFNYNGNNTQPRVNEIQPIRVNTDPLNIVIGNPNLDPSFTNRFSLYYNSYKVLTEESIYLNGSYNFTSNAIVNNTTTDSAGKSTFQSINLTDKMPSNFYFYADFGRAIKKLGLNVGLGFNGNGNTFYNYINNELNTTKSYNISGSLYLSKYKAKKYSMRASFGPNYNTSESSLQEINNNGWGYNGDAYFTFFLPGKIELSANGNYQFTAATESFNEDFERFIVNASISKKFFKQENFRIQVSGNDLLNENVGFSRSAYGNRISQNSYTTIQRYFMFSLIWDFNKMGGAPSNK